MKEESFLDLSLFWATVAIVGHVPRGDSHVDGRRPGHGTAVTEDPRGGCGMGKPGSRGGFQWARETGTFPSSRLDHRKVCNFGVGSRFRRCCGVGERDPG